jgi:dTDP-4-dehydrorhamnose reductase
LRILLTGRDGQVGWELERSLQVLGDIFAFDRRGMDLGDADAIRAREALGPM